MSSVYATEPVTSGRVVFETTHGPIDIHLWCRECPYTTKVFLQLCLDGYYNNMIFHRIVPNLLIQTGSIRCLTMNNPNDMMNTINPDRSTNNNSSRFASSNRSSNTEKNEQSFGKTRMVTMDFASTTNNLNNNSSLMDQYRKLIQVDIALDRGKKYECNNSRIRFNHRGQVALAVSTTENNDDKNNHNDDNNNNNNNKIRKDYDIQNAQPQFFITTEDAEYLNGKHVIFGTVSSSPTMFNVLRINQQTDVHTENIISGGNDSDVLSSSTTTVLYQPTDLENAPRILSVRILDNPIHTSLTPTVRVPWEITNIISTATNKGTKSKRKGKLDVNVLSFGDEVNETTISSIVPKARTAVPVDDVSNNVLKEESTTVQRSKPQDDLVLGNRSSSDGQGTDHYHSPRNGDNIDSNKTFQHWRDNKTTGNLDDCESKTSNNDVQHPKILVESDTKFESSYRSESTEQQQYQPQERLKERNKSLGSDSENNTTTTTTTETSRLSVIERRRAQYLKNKHPKSKQQREEETIAKLLKFKGKIWNPNNNDTIETDSNNPLDNSLAARMARRAATAQHHHEVNPTDIDKTNDQPHYHGQVLYDDDDDNNNTHTTKNSTKQTKWYSTNFTCKRYAASEVPNNLVAGDGRSTDDYEVIDDKYKTKQKRLRTSYPKEQRK